MSDETEKEKEAKYSKVSLTERSQYMITRNQGPELFIGLGIRRMWCFADRFLACDRRLQRAGIVRAVAGLVFGADVFVVDGP